MATNHSEAYDLSVFETKSAKITPLPSKKEAKADRRRAKVQSLLNGAATAMIAACVVVILALMITSQVRLTEMNNAISHTEAQLSEAIGETKRLESELASQTSAQSVENYAASVGLRPMESGQIDYITVPVPEETITETETPGFWASIWNALTGWMR